MKIHCSQCGAKFNYEEHSGICPKCMEYHLWQEGGKPPEINRNHRFFLWLFAFLAAAALAFFPVVYQIQRAKYEEREAYKKELKAELEGEAVQEFSQGEMITTGVYIVTPKPYVWLPKVETIGMDEQDSYLLAVPLEVLKGEKSPMERRYEYRLELQEEIVNLDFGTYRGEKYWPKLEGYFPDYLYSVGEKKERQYLLFQMKENADPAEVILCIDEFMIEQDSFEETLIHTYKIPVVPADENAAALEPILCYGHLDVKTVSPGMAFGYYDTRLIVEEVRCLSEAGSFVIPEGKKLVLATIRRDDSAWPHTEGFDAYTALIDNTGNVFPCIRDWELEKYLGLELEDLNNYYFDYNFKAEPEDENPETVIQAYLIDETIEKTEIIFPGLSEIGEDGVYGGYWQIRVPITIPEAGETTIYELQQRQVEGRNADGKYISS